MKTQKYIRHSIVELAPALAAIRSTDTKAPFNGVTVNVTSTRLQTFATRGCKCSSCGLEATHFALERFPNTQSYHLNLWAIHEGVEVLMTHDHTLARSLGGADNLSNTTTMCSPCNFEKSHAEGLLAAQRRGIATGPSKTAVRAAKRAASKLKNLTLSQNNAL